MLDPDRWSALFIATNPETSPGRRWRAMGRARGAGLRAAGVLALLLALGCAGTARAELDYEFGMRLMEAGQSTFQTSDLVERLIEKLKASPATQWDGQLLDAARKRRLAESAVIERQAQLLGEADAIYKEFVAKAPKDHRLREKAEDGEDSVLKDRVRTLIRAAQSTTDPAKARELRQQAKEALERIAKEQRAIADAAYPKYVEAFKVWDKFVQEKGWEAPVPPQILDPLDKWFDEWVVADKRWFALKADQLDCYDDKDPEKKKLGTELLGLIEKRLDDQGVLTFPLVEAFYHFIRGRIHAALGESDKARESWRTVLNIQIENPTEEQKRYLEAFKASIFSELVRMNMRLNQYKDVIEDVHNAARNIEALITGAKQSLVDYGKALSLYDKADREDYEEGVRDFSRFIRQEEKSGHPYWQGEFYVALAEVLDAARKRGLRLRLSPDEWYQAARGYFLAGQRLYANFTDREKEDPAKAGEYFEQARAEYEKAVRVYQQAVTAVRAARGDLAARLQIEPKCWMEMGFCQYRMRNYLETVTALTALVEQFHANRRKVWMPDAAKPEGKRFYTAMVKELLKQLDQPNTGAVAIAVSLISECLKDVAKTRTPWRTAFRPKYLEQHPEVREIAVEDKEYLAATSALDGAEASAALAASLADPKAASDAYQKGAAAYVAAGEKFLAVKPASKVRERSLYEAAICYVKAKGMWASGRVALPAEQVAAKVAELSRKGMECLDQFDRADLRRSELDEDQKKRLRGGALMARVSLHLGTGEYEKAIAAADKYVAWEAENPGVKLTAEVLFDKMRALLELAKPDSPKCDEYLKAAAAVLQDYRSVKPDDTRGHLYMIDALRGRYGALYREARARKLPPEAEDRYLGQTVQMQMERMKLLENIPGAAPPMAEYYRTLLLLNAAHDYPSAIEWGLRLVNRFDPEGKGCRIPDEAAVWKAILERMFSVIKYPDLVKINNCRNDHTALIDYMYDTDEGRAYPEGSDKRPSGDKFPQDLDRALQQIQTIKNNYPDSNTLNAAYGRDSKSLVEAVREEIDFRKKVTNTRKLVQSMCLDLGAKLAKDPNRAEEVRKYRETATSIINWFLEQGSKDALTLEVLKAELLMNNERYQEAIVTFADLKEKLPKNHELYFDVSRNIAMCFAELGKWPEAADYPEFLVLTAGLKATIIQERWPGIRDFLRRCYEHGVPMPDAVRIKLEEKTEPELDTEPKIGETKDEGTPAKKEETGKQEEPGAKAEATEPKP